jgi:hypothetical protein
MFQFSLGKGKRVCWALIVLLFSALAVSDLQAQVTTAVLSGTAMDTTGAVVAGAKIQAKNDNTGISYSAVTNGQGRYSIPELPVGTYDVSALISGFQNVVQTGVVMTVGARPVLDFTLKVSHTEEVVQVHGQASNVDTETATVGQLFSSSQMKGLPLNGRNFTDLLALAPSVSMVPTGATTGGYSVTAYGAQTNYSVSGSRPVGTAYLMDGIDVRDAMDHGMGVSVTGTSLGMDAIQEFKVLTNTYSAEFGGTGAAVNMVTASGTNNLHGSAYEFIRNSAMDAMNYFDVPGVKPAFKRNQFGGTLGSPIKKDKAFFFINYEGLRSATGSTERGVVPTSLPDLFEAGGMTQISGQWVGPFGPINPLAEQVFGLYPLAQSPSQCPNVTNITLLAGTGLYCSSDPSIGNEDYGMGRVDYTIGTKDSLFGRYNIENAYQTIPYPAAQPGVPMGIPGYSETDNERNQYAAIEERHTFSPTVLNEVRFGLVRLDMNMANGGLSNTNALTQGSRLAPMSFDPGQGLTPLGGASSDPNANITNRLSVGDDVTMVRGAHSISLGLTFTRVQSNLLDNPNFNTLGGLNIFAGLGPGAIPGTPLGSSLYGMPLLDLISSGPGWTYTAPSGVTYPWTPSRYWRQNQMAPYIQDDWKINKRLTLNLGVRYEWASNPTMVSGPLFVLNNVLSATTTESSFTVAHNFFNSNPNVKNIDPRIGLAFDPFGDHKTSIRAGFGMFHEPITAADFGVMSMNPSAPNLEVFFSPNLWPNNPTSFGTYSSDIAWLYAMLPNVDTAPYMMQYNLTVERQLWAGTVFNIGYNGSTGVHLMAWIDVNPPLAYGALTSAQLNAPGANGAPSIAQTYAGTGATGQGTPGSLTNPFAGLHRNPNLGAIEADTPTAHSSYNSLQTSLSRQFAQTLVGNVDYTWSRCIDDSSSASSMSQIAGSVSDPLDERVDRGPCSFNSNQVFRANAIYSLPFHGNRAVNGWQVSSIFNRYTGLPLQIANMNGSSYQSDIAGATESERPNIVPGCNPMTKKMGEWWNPACFVLQPYGTVSTSGRNALVNPNYFSADFALIKNTKLTERVHAEFRAEFFNIFNHPNFSAGNAAFLFTTVTNLPTYNANYSQRTNPAAYKEPNPTTGDPGGVICNPSQSPTAAVVGPCYVASTAINQTMPGNLGGQREIQVALKLSF